MGQAYRLFGEARQMRSQDHAAAVSAPVVHVQSGIELRQEGTAAVAEDALDEIQIAHQITRGEKADLHALLPAHTGDLGADHRPQQQGDEHLHRLGTVGRKGDAQQLRRRSQGLLEHTREGLSGHRLLVSRDRQAAFSDVEGTFGGAPVAGRIVQHPLSDPVAGDDVRVKLILPQGQGKLSGHPVAVEHEGHVRQFWYRFGDVLQIAVEKVLDAPVRRTEVVGQQAILLPIALEQIIGGLQKSVTVSCVGDRLSRRGQFQIDVEMQFLLLFFRAAGRFRKSQ